MVLLLPLLGSTTAAVLDKEGLGLYLPYSGPLLYSPGGSSLLQGCTAQEEQKKDVGTQ